MEMVATYHLCGKTTQRSFVSGKGYLAFVVCVRRMVVVSLVRVSIVVMSLVSVRRMVMPLV
jgi:hypothetical protein